MFKQKTVLRSEIRLRVLFYGLAVRTGIIALQKFFFLLLFFLLFFLSANFFFFFFRSIFFFKIRLKKLTQHDVLNFPIFLHLFCVKNVFAFIS